MQRNNNSKTPLEYYEKAILQLTETQAELQEELKSIREMNLSHEDLKVQLQEAREEIEILKDKLKSSEEEKETLEQAKKQIKSNEKNTTYLYEEMQGFKQEVARVKTDISRIEIEAKEAKEKAHEVFNIASEMPHEPDETKIERIETNTNYLYGEVEKLKEALSIKQKQLDKAQKDINLASLQTSEISAKLNEISQNANISRTLPYRKLERYLMTRQWKKADKETFVKIQELVGKVGYSRLSEEDLSRLSYNELAFIDQLWLKYSQGYFGLSVQKKIYQSIGGNRNIDREIWKRFGKKVGWYVNHKWIWYGDIKFSRDAPSGHLPARVWDAYNKGGVGSFNQLMARLINCKL